MKKKSALKQKRKAEKRNRKKLRKKQKLKIENNKSRPKPWEPVKMGMAEISNPFPAEIPKEKRLEVIRNIGAKAKGDFDDKYLKIQNWFIDYDPIYILSFCAFYFLSWQEGIDPEASGHRDFYWHYLEIMQAFALYEKRTLSARPLLNQAIKLKQDMKEIGDLMQLRLLAIPEDLKSDEEINAFVLRTEMMSNTIAIRNWAYLYQIRRIVGDLATLVKGDFEDFYDVDPFKLMEALFKLAEEKDDLINLHIDKIRNFFRKKDYKEMVKAYNQSFPENVQIEGETVDEVWNSASRNLKTLRSMLIFHSDLKLEKIFLFDLDHFTFLYGDATKKDKLKVILDKLSYSFGDLKGFKQEFIILDNPVHHRPFILMGPGYYYSSVLCIFPHLSLGLLEDLIAENDSLRKKYSDSIKAKYLEDEIERLFRLHFPNAQIFRGSQWEDSTANKYYENDLIVIVDTFALIIEAKSGAVSPPAKRGAPDRLFETLRELIEEPSEQAHRFITFLKNNKNIHTFTNKKGGNNIIDSSKINYFIPLGITFANLGAIGSNLKKIIEAGITGKKIGDLAPSINLTDLESIFEVLPLEAEKIHYFARRREIEDHIKYEGDEMDLLAFYLDTGFNIGDAEFDSNFLMFLTLKSKELDAYFLGVNEGINVSIPALGLTKWWHALLTYIADKKPANWMETSFILLNTQKADQEKFEQKFRNLSNKIKLGKADKRHNWVEFLSGPERRRYFIAGYPYSIEAKKERNNIIYDMLYSERTQKIRGSLVIAIDLNEPLYPYNVIAGKLDTNLFDILSSRDS